MVTEYKARKFPEHFLWGASSSAFQIEGAAAEDGKPKCIIAHTVKGKGVSFMENQVGWHGKAPSEEERRQALKELEEES